jgi:hypothetical protein
MKIVLLILLSALLSVSAVASIPQNANSLPSIHGCPPRCGGGPHAQDPGANRTSAPLVLYPTTQEIFAYLQKEGLKKEIEAITNRTTNGVPSNAQIANSGNITWLGFQGNLEGINLIFLSLSLDGGKNFSEPFRVSAPNGGNASNLQLGVSDDGNFVYTTWQETNMTTGINRIMLSSSMDGGREFKTYTLNPPGDGNAVDPRLKVVGDNLVLVWLQDEPGNCSSTGGVYCSHGGRW